MYRIKNNMVKMNKDPKTTAIQNNAPEAPGQIGTYKPITSKKTIDLLLQPGIANSQTKMQFTNILSEPDPNGLLKINKLTDNLAGFKKEDAEFAPLNDINLEKLECRKFGSQDFKEWYEKPCTTNPASVKPNWTKKCLGDQEIKEWLHKSTIKSYKLHQKPVSEQLGNTTNRPKVIINNTLNDKRRKELKQRTEVLKANLNGLDDTIGKWRDTRDIVAVGRFRRDVPEEVPQVWMPSTNVIVGSTYILALLVILVYGVFRNLFIS